MNKKNDKLLLKSMAFITVLSILCIMGLSASAYTAMFGLTSDIFPLSTDERYETRIEVEDLNSPFIEFTHATNIPTVETSSMGDGVLEFKSLDSGTQPGIKLTLPHKTNRITMRFSLVKKEFWINDHAEIDIQSVAIRQLYFYEEIGDGGLENFGLYTINGLAGEKNNTVTISAAISTRGATWRLDYLVCGYEEVIEIEDTDAVAWTYTSNGGSAAVPTFIRQVGCFSGSDNKVIQLETNRYAGFNVISGGNRLIVGYSTNTPTGGNPTLIAKIGDEIYEREVSNTSGDYKTLNRLIIDNVTIPDGSTVLLTKKNISSTAGLALDFIRVENALPVEFYDATDDTQPLETSQLLNASSPLLTNGITAKVSAYNPSQTSWEQNPVMVTAALVDKKTREIVSIGTEDIKLAPGVSGSFALNLYPMKLSPDKDPADYYFRIYAWDSLQSLMPYMRARIIQ